MDPIDEPSSKPPASWADLSDVTKTVNDLDGLVSAIVGGLPATKPWQRQAHGQLAEADRSMQVLRLAISLERGQGELVDAARQVQLSLRAARAFIYPSRADLTTKAAAKLAADLADKLHARLVRAAAPR